MVLEPIPDQHTYILTYSHTHRQIEFYNIRYTHMHTHMLIHTGETRDTETIEKRDMDAL